MDQILADEHYTSPTASPTSAGTTEWFLGDNQGTVRDIVTSSGLIDHLTYDAFGKLTGQSGSGAYPSTDVIFAGYTGTFTDLATGLQWHNDPSSGYTGRWYNPSLQRWMSKDPTGLGPDSNPYRYVRNAATSFTAPTGLQPPPKPIYVPWDSPPITLNPRPFPIYRPPLHLPPSYIPPPPSHPQPPEPPPPQIGAFRPECQRAPTQGEIWDNIWVTQGAEKNYWIELYENFPFQQRRNWTGPGRGKLPIIEPGGGGTPTNGP